MPKKKAVITKTRIDLHTHPIEALSAESPVRTIRDITGEVVDRIAGSISAAGLDGIAVTEHNNFNYGWVVALEMKRRFPGGPFVLPGEEIEYGGQHFLRIFIPDNIRGRAPFFKGRAWFVILAHPGYYATYDPAQFQDLAIDAVEEESRRGKYELAGQISAARDIPATRGSDAHRLEDIGLCYTELDVEGF